jgi:hypothetical protein
MQGSGCTDLLHVNFTETMRREDCKSTRFTRSPSLVQLMGHAVVSVDKRTLKVFYVHMWRLRKCHVMLPVGLLKVEVEGAT